MALLVFHHWVVRWQKPNVPFAGRLSYYTDAQRRGLTAFCGVAGAFLSKDGKARTERRQSAIFSTPQMQIACVELNSLREGLLIANFQIIIIKFRFRMLNGSSSSL